MRRLRLLFGISAIALGLSSIILLTHLLKPQSTLGSYISYATVGHTTISIPTPTPTPYLWPVRSIDTMKHSRDLARQQESSHSFDAAITTQVKNIAATGATHIAIDTPYDQEFLPVLTNWVSAARAAHLNVWYRGNWSGWEQWFGYVRMTPEAHIAKTTAFIQDNPSLFQNGDIFTACPECENGALGDPRKTGRVKAFRQFMLSEYTATSSAFTAQSKNVVSNYSAMNYDVASLVYTPQFATDMGGVITVDHYVTSPALLVDNLNQLSQRTGATIVLGEFGAPIPDLHGKMTEAQQANWIGNILEGLKNNRKVIGINYWVNVGGSTALWNDDLRPRQAVSILTNAYTPVK